METIPLERPPLHLIDCEADTLADLALRIEHSQPNVSALLLKEIYRARIYARDALPTHVVAMHSHVTFVDEGSGALREVQLSYPGDADIACGRISVLTLVGAGLIGLSQGQMILWPDRDGHERRLRIKRVRPGASN